MSLTYKFDKQKENNSGVDDQQNNESVEKEIERYDTIGHSRNVCFVNKDGRRTFLNYSFLVSGKFLPEEGQIKLFFPNHLISISGTNLESLYTDFLNQQAKVIYELDKRYSQILPDFFCLIGKIEIVDIKSD